MGSTGIESNSATAPRMAAVTRPLAAAKAKATRAKRGSGTSSGTSGGGERKPRASKATAKATAKTEPQTALAKAAAREQAKQPEVAGQVHNVPMNLIKAEINPREMFDPEGIAELAASIKKNGLLQPPTVRPKGDGTYQLIAGERRMRAMQALGRTSMDVIIKHVSEEEAKKMAFMENVNRKDMLPGETARAYQQFIKDGMTPEEIAQQFGKKLSSVQDHLALNNLEPHLQALVDRQAGGKGKGLAFSLVGPLARLTPANREKAAEAIMSKGLGVQKAKSMIDALHARENQMTLFGAPEHGAKTKAAHERYSVAMERLTNTLGSLDNETLDQMIPAVANPDQEQQRVALAIKQLQRIHSMLGKAAANDFVAGM